MSDVSAFGVIHKSTREERAKRRALTGMGVGVGAGAATSGAFYTGRNYLHSKNQLRDAWDAGERRKQFAASMADLDAQMRWASSAGYKTEKVWEPGVSSDSFTSPKQAERVRRLRDLANHPSTGANERKVAEERLKRMGYSTKPKHETPGRWRTKATRVPQPERIVYEPKPWKHPGFKNLLRSSTKARGFKMNLGMAMLGGATTGMYAGTIAGIRHHQKKEGLGSYRKKKR